MGHRRKLDTFIEESSARQRNIVFPNTVRNGRSVDAFLWNGSPDPPLVQRIAAWMFGLSFLFMGFAFLAAGFVHRDDAWILGLLSIPCILLGLKIFRNGFPRPNKGTPTKS
jgi:hypothetical protein